MGCWNSSASSDALSQNPKHEKAVRKGNHYITKALLANAKRGQDVRKANHLVAQNFEIRPQRSCSINVQKTGNNSAIERTNWRALPISLRGVSLSCLNEVKVKYGRRNGYGMLAALVRPETDKCKCSLAELWRDKVCGNKKAFGGVTVFISHAWRNRFGALVEAISSWEREDKSREGAYYFFDIFAINQHDPWSDLKCIEDLIANSKALLLVLSPLNNPIPLSRVWCLFEIHAAIKHATELVCTFPDMEQNHFRTILLTATNSQENVLSFKIDSKNANASVQDDALRIKDAVQRDIGFIGLDQQVHNSVCNLLLKQASKEIENSQVNSLLEEELHINMSRLFGELNQVSKKYDDQIRVQNNDRKYEQNLQEILLRTQWNINFSKDEEVKVPCNGSILPTVCLQQSQTYKLNSLKDISWKQCYKNSVEPSELLWLLEYVWSQDIQTTIIMIIFDFIPVTWCGLPNQKLDNECWHDDASGVAEVMENVVKFMGICYKCEFHSLSRIITRFRQTIGQELWRAANMLESHTDYIETKIKDQRYHSFISYHQSVSSDLVRSLHRVLEQQGSSTCFDKAADRLDVRGIVDGIKSSRTFILVLTNKYFEMPFCLFEFCTAYVLRKPIIIIKETDPRFGGRSYIGIDSLFEWFVEENESIDINRRKFQSFVTNLHKRIQLSCRSNLDL